jgi:hypothetical protein
MVLVQANGHVGQQGAVADYLEVDSRYERAVSKRVSASCSSTSSLNGTIRRPRAFARSSTTQDAAGSS